MLGIDPCVDVIRPSDRRIVWLSMKIFGLPLEVDVEFVLGALLSSTVVYHATRTLFLGGVQRVKRIKLRLSKYNMPPFFVGSLPRVAMGIDTIARTIAATG